MSEVRKLWIKGPAGRLEAALRVAAVPRATAVVSHPHPLFGGTLHNPVVFHADRELNRRGLTSLRFNFRGVGSSEGRHDEGRGEVGDVAAAAAWVRGTSSAAPLVLVGYSFGSWCSIRHAVEGPSVAAVVAIGLPVRTFDFESLARLRKPFAVVQGEYDEFGSPAEVRRAIARAGIDAAIRVIPDAPHLFPGRAPEAAATAADAVDALLDAVRRSSG